MQGCEIKLKSEMNPKYKTKLCKHFNTPKGCSYGDKCQYTHGTNELKSNDFNQGSLAQIPIIQNNPQNVLINYKTQRCKNFEKNGICKYGELCTYAHGDKDLRTKDENITQMNQLIFGMMFANQKMMNQGFILPVKCEPISIPEMTQFQEGNGGHF